MMKRFFEDFKKEHLRFVEYIHGIDDEYDCRWYASVLLNRLMFIYFLQLKGFLDNGNLDYTPGGRDDEISPHVLGYIFEKYINQKSFGAYYTHPEITEYLCERTIHKLILEKINAPAISGLTPGRHFDTVEELLMDLDARLCRDLLEILPSISILDPACGSGAFLVSAMNTLTTIYGAITGRIEYVNDNYLKEWLKKARHEH